jgi:hypothetical protein
MLGVALVVAELVFFALVFYFFWVREPVRKPYKIKGNPWGNYSPSGHSTSNTKKPQQHYINQ